MKPSLPLNKFQATYGSQVKVFLDSEAGQHWVQWLSAWRPSPQCEPLEHQAAYRLGGVSGYEQCLANMENILILKTPMKPIEQNYGVTAKKLEELKQSEEG